MVWNKFDIPKKRELISHIRSGKSNQQIADEYFVSSKTIGRWFRHHDIIKKEYKVG